MTIPSLLEAEKGLAARLDGAAAIFLGLDFDGTLTPLCPRPEAVTLDRPMREVLERLSTSSKITLMIVSGRGLEDVAGRVALPSLIYAGNHGMEIRGRGLTFLEPRAAATVPLLRELTAKLHDAFSHVPGALVEFKGLTASVHYRNVPDEFQEAMERKLKEAVSAHAEHLRLTSGHRVWEIRPNVDWHKGEALKWALGRSSVHPSGLVFYLGDDRTDEDAFDCLPQAVTVRIGPPDVSTHARYRLADPCQVFQFLTWLGERLGV
jgi:trehalose-phosphatase